MPSGKRGLWLGFYIDSDPFNSTNSDGSTIRGLNIINVPGSAIFIDQTDDHSIVCNHIGLTNGNVEAGNLIGVSVFSAFYFAENNTIGGAAVVDRNVISGNTTAGIRNDGFDTLIEGNYIGVDKTGDLARGNGDDGINNLEDDAIVRNNVISDNGIYGIRLLGDDHIIQGNKIGTSADGTAALGNFYAGIIAIGDNVTIGGTTAATDRNIISANGGGGLWLKTSNSLVQGNYIGVAANGTSPLGNGSNGVFP